MPSSIEARVMGKFSRHLVWYLFLLFFVCVLDRVNIGFAALSMNKQLGLTAQMFGIAAGLFSVGYLVLEVPSNLILHKVGARRWICRIMITWGIVSMAMSLVRGPNSFYIFRFVLGMAEAGFFPGILLYLSYWCPAAHRARFSSMFLLAIPISQTLAATISGLILHLDGVLNVPGWQWLFLIEGAPAILLGAVTYFYLPDRPADARWLSTEEKDWLAQTLSSEERAYEKSKGEKLSEVLLDPKTLLLGSIYAGINLVLTGVPLWLPQIIRGAGFSYFATGIAAALPPLVGAVAMVLWSRSSDRHLERSWHLVSALLVCAIGWMLSFYAMGHATLMIACFVIASCGVLAATSVFWSIPSTLLTGRSAAGGIAVIGLMGNLAGAVGPFIMGSLRDHSGNFGTGFLFMAAAVIVSAGIVLAARFALLGQLDTTARQTRTSSQAA